MYRKLTITAAVMILGLGATAPTMADHCGGNTTPIGLPREDRPGGGNPSDTTFYLYEDDDGAYSFYEETNGIRGLQQGGTGFPVPGTGSGPCGHSTPDKRHF